VTARRKTSPPEQKPPLQLLMPVPELRARIAARIVKGNEVLQAPTNSEEALQAARDKYYTWTKYNETMLRQAATNDDLWSDYSQRCPITVLREMTLAEKISEHHDDIQEKIRRLESISERLELIPVAEHVSRVATGDAGSSPAKAKPSARAPEGQRGAVIEGDPRKVLVVHGRNEGVRSAMFSFLRAIHLDPIEWSEEVAATGEGSPHVSMVLDAAFSMAKAVVAVLTPDEEVRLREDLRSAGDEPSDCFGYQARPNVLFEAGMAMGRCPKRTILVEIGRMRPFSDVGGRHAVRLNNSAEQRKELAQRLQTAGCKVNLLGKDWLSAGDFEGPGQFAPPMPPETSKPPAGRSEDIDPVDAINMMEEWFRAAAERRKWGMVPVTFAKVDQELGLPPGTAKKYLTEAADGCGYKADRVGPKTGVFKHVPAPLPTQRGRLDGFLP
jgi:predicted nucleotide-binding protein